MIIPEQKEENTERFVVYSCKYISYIGYAYILVDKETRVQYLYTENNDRSTLVVIIDSLGKPVVYNGILLEGTITN